MKLATFAFAADAPFAEYVKEIIHAQDNPKVLPVFDSVHVVISASQMFGMQSGITYFFSMFVPVCASEG